MRSTTAVAWQRLAVGVMMALACAGAASGQEDEPEASAFAGGAQAPPEALAEAPPEALPESPISIRLARDDEPSRQTRDQLLRLLDEYDLSSRIFTREIVVDSGGWVTPHSHPVLTLSTRHLRDDELLLATFVHEQLHWHVAARGEALARARADLAKLFPEVPVGYPEGAQDQRSTYLHLVVCYLEYHALIGLLGELRARWVIEFWTHDHYTWVYRTLLERGRDIGRIVEEQGLMP